MSKHYDPIMCMMVEDKVKVRDKRAADEGIDTQHIAEYLWTWRDGYDISSALFSEGLNHYKGPDDKEHREEARKFARAYALDKLDNIENQVKNAALSIIKSGSTTIYRQISAKGSK